MKQFQLQPNGEQGFEVTLVEVAEPEPGPNEVVVKVHAVALNYRDLLMREGKSASSVKAGGTVPCSDGAGEVVSLGEGVTRVSVGDRVMASFFLDWLDGGFDMRYHRSALGGSVNGMLSETVVLPERALVKVPAHLSYVEAACFPCAGVTAWYALGGERWF